MGDFAGSTKVDAHASGSLGSLADHRPGTGPSSSLLSPTAPSAMSADLDASMSLSRGFGMGSGIQMQWARKMDDDMRGVKKGQRELRKTVECIRKGHEEMMGMLQHIHY